MRKHPLALPGIYRITRKSDGKAYVGQARKVSQRLASHRLSLDKGTHRNGPLQEAWNQEGPDGFAWDLVAQPIGGHEAESMTYLEREVMLAYPDRFNLMEPIQAYLGASASTRELLSGINRARWDDPEYKARMSEIHKARLATPEAKAARSKTMRESSARPEVRAARSAGQIASWDDDRRAARGAKTAAHWEDPEHRAQQTASRKGVWASYTPEQRQARIDAAAAGRHRKPMRSTLEVCW